MYYIMKSIYISLIGQPRNTCVIIDNLNKLFENIDYNISVNLVFNSNYDVCDNIYVNNKINLHEIINKNNVDSLLIVKENEQSKKFINYLNKISLSTNHVPDEHDYYILMRADLYLNDILFLNNVICDETIYFSDKLNNNKSLENNNSINDQIIITKKWNNIRKLKDISKNINHEFGENAMYNYIMDNNIKYDTIDINYKLILSYCNIIAISGDSGSGKTTLLNEINNILGNKNTLKLETDRYHKWERGNENYKQYTHLNPYANHLEKMSNDLFDLKIGNNIYSVDYDHSNGKFTQIEKIESSPCVILCGLHTLYVDHINNILDIKIFMDTDRKLIKKWKIDRDVKERGHKLEKILKQIDDRENDYKLYIESQKNNANIIINFYENNNELKCRMKITKDIYDRLSLYINKMEYKIGDDLQFELHCINCDDIVKKFMLDKKINIILSDIDNYYSEIRLFFVNLVYN